MIASRMFIAPTMLLLTTELRNAYLVKQVLAMLTNNDQLWYSSTAATFRAPHSFADAAVDLSSTHSHHVSYAITLRHGNHCNMNNGWHAKAGNPEMSAREKMKCVPCACLLYVC
jgi:hypothetical protein